MKKNYIIVDEGECMKIFWMFFIGLCYGVEVTPEIYLFGFSKHSKETWNDGKHTYDFNEINPGIAYGAVCEGYSFKNSKIDYIASCGFYLDSYNQLAQFAMPGIRYTWNDRISFDISAGYYNGSYFHGFGFAPSVGIRVFERLWIHVTGSPTSGDTEAAMIAGFIRIEL